mmetsp:Transcript_1461/g.1937  ORF Transcript_1461/g.1937 Transcript_1461/m.1937 type:complete len:236 (-) Transcript_1461:267-974(-)
MGFLCASIPRQSSFYLCHSFVNYSGHCNRALTSFYYDSWIGQKSVTPNVNLIESQLLGGTSICLIPPCCLLDFRGLINYMAPLSFVYNNVEDFHAVSRILYTRFWCRLSAISSLPGMVLHLCKLFENLLAHSSFDLFSHMLSLGVKPLDIAFPWLHSAFARCLEVEQVLLLWDRIIGFGDLDLLPILATSVFLFRAESILNAKTETEIQVLLSDISQMKVVPLLQAFLFSESLLI